jgi:hypothetical protein
MLILSLTIFVWDVRTFHVQRVRVKCNKLRVETNATHLLRKVNPPVLTNNSITFSENVHLCCCGPHRLELSDSQLAHK